MCCVDANFFHYCFKVWPSNHRNVGHLGLVGPTFLFLCPLDSFPSISPPGLSDQWGSSLVTTSRPCSKKGNSASKYGICPLQNIFLDWFWLHSILRVFSMTRNPFAMLMKCLQLNLEWLDKSWFGIHWAEIDHVHFLDTQCEVQQGHFFMAPNASVSLIRVVSSGGESESVLYRVCEF